MSIDSLYAAADREIDRLEEAVADRDATIAELRKVLEPFAKRPRDFCIRDLKNAEAALANPAPSDLLAEFKVKLDRILFCLYVSLALNFVSYFILLLK